mgnify:CR=1 FL=1
MSYWVVYSLSFKPYYKWNTFNTNSDTAGDFLGVVVLNLIINGIPSIQSLMCT